jgi:hypothetical protein
MVHGMDGAKQKGKPWKTRIERDIKFSEDIKESGIQGGKVIGENLAILSFIIGIPLLIIGMYALINILFGFGFPTNVAIIILVIIINVIGFLLVIGGYFIYKS